MIEDREAVVAAYSAGFQQIGQKLEAFSGSAFTEWFEASPKSEWESIEGAILGECDEVERYVRMLSGRANIPSIVLVEGVKLETILSLFSAGADDVVRKPVHIRELLCRLSAIRRRGKNSAASEPVSSLKIFFDGRDPIVAGTPLELPRRERRILEYFVVNFNKRLSKEQIFNAVYGVFEENVCEAVVESHICKLRKKLKDRLGYDPIDSKRYLGYCFQYKCGAPPVEDYKGDFRAYL